MDWSKFLSNWVVFILPTLIALITVAISWRAQAWTLIKPGDNKKVGKELLKLSNKMLIIVVIIAILVGISLELAIWLPWI